MVQPSLDRQDEYFPAAAHCRKMGGTCIRARNLQLRLENALQLNRLRCPDTKRHTHYLWKSSPHHALSLRQPTRLRYL